MRPGEDLINLVLKALDIREGAFFGLTFKSFQKSDQWVRLRPKLADQGIPRDKVANFKFSVRIFPSPVEEFLLQASSRHFIFLACKAKIMSGELDCPADVCALLAGFDAQAEFGDFKAEEHQTFFLSSKGPFMPSSAVQKHQLSSEQWESKVFNWWRDNRGLSKIEAEQEYLKVVQKLETYGVYYFDAMNKTGSPVVCGITFDGLNIYKQDNKSRPHLTFKWNETNYVKKKNGKVD
ncbi:uncharacterized protein TRIADDRAFT_29123 [Trichoplax adhaerens]|uniref:FERM domain-containing protein n=1 Tax=Trichoplax adhaerens TaxID=10228 RepID=B3S533_TRIAD|nr:hypothetical protein TRIADDRAFT_29123 [Trichoplax adhaerens]EDV22194.1 hypothetical protein TRIADDRAFT_29123 [Trichoplax adhaerens]|eukprot:XP_002115349.1 hypothetical protein TRIADDRAFT_29123 [Trichoplax adhaerens]